MPVVVSSTSLVALPCVSPLGRSAASSLRRGRRGFSSFLSPVVDCFVGCVGHALVKSAYPAVHVACSVALSSHSGRWRSASSTLRLLCGTCRWLLPSAISIALACGPSSGAFRCRFCGLHPPHLKSQWPQATAPAWGRPGHAGRNVMLLRRTRICCGGRSSTTPSSILQSPKVTFLTAPLRTPKSHSMELRCLDSSSSCPSCGYDYGLLCSASSPAKKKGRGQGYWRLAYKAE